MGVSGVSVTRYYFKVYKYMVQESLLIFLIFYWQYNVFYCDRKIIYFHYCIEKQLFAI